MRQIKTFTRGTRVDGGPERHAHALLGRRPHQHYARWRWPTFYIEGGIASRVHNKARPINQSGAHELGVPAWVFNPQSGFLTCRRVACSGVVMSVAAIAWKQSRQPGKTYDAKPTQVETVVVVRYRVHPSICASNRIGVVTFSLLSVRTT